jgi:1-acyl-sn-glycerol-3-phosphate acyltransferase
MEGSQIRRLTAADARRKPRRTAERLSRLVQERPVRSAGRAIPLTPAGADREQRPRGSEPHAARAADLNGFREHALSKGVNPLLYWTLRAVLVPFFLIYLRMSRIGREHLPRSGSLLLAANHRSFLDPFVIGTLVRRPVYYMAKRELFERRWQAWALNALGAFPVDRGAGDHDAMRTAKEILMRGDCVVIFPEGTRTRRGPLSEPHRGVGRLALETGAQVAPVAVIGTEAVRRGWRVRPRKVRLRVGRPLRFPTVPEPSPRLAAGVTRRIWACVNLQWAWLGGEDGRADLGGDAASGRSDLGGEPGGAHGGGGAASAPATRPHARETAQTVEAA